MLASASGLDSAAVPPAMVEVVSQQFGLKRCISDCIVFRRSFVDVSCTSLSSCSCNSKFLRSCNLYHSGLPLCLNIAAQMIFDAGDTWEVLS